MGVLLALAAAAAYGLSDFVGGLASRRTTPWAVAFVGALSALVVGAAMMPLFAGHASGGDLAWGALAGVGSGFGGAMLYRGMAAGRMALVGPVSAVASAALPVVVGVAVGERPSPLVWLGIALALPGIWLAASSGEETRTAHDGAALRDGLLAGAGFGLLFVALGQVPGHAGLAPFVVCEALATTTVAVLAVLTGQRWLPSGGGELWGVAAGVLAALAQLAFLLAAQMSLLSVSSVLTSLYPAVTVLLAVAVLREHISLPQSLGLLLCAGTIVLVAAG